MSTRAVAASTLWQFASQMMMALLSMVTVKLVAIGLTKELAGNYNSAYGFLALFGILADFGLYAVAVRDVSRAQDKGEAIGAFLVLRCITIVLSLTCALLIVWTVPAWRGTPLPLGVTIAALAPLFTLFAGVFRVVFQVHFRMHYVFVAEVSQRLLTTLLIALLVWHGMRGSSNLHDYHVLLFIGGVGAFLLFFVSGMLASRLENVRPTFNRERILHLLRQAAPFGIAYICMAMYRQLDLTLIALLRDDFEMQNAYYGFVLRMTDMGFLLPTFLLNSMLPLLNAPSAERRDTAALLGWTLLALLCLGTTGALMAGLWSRPLVALLTTPQYLSTLARPGADTALQLLAVPILCNGLVLYAFYTLLARGSWKPLVVTLTGGAIASVMLNLVLIPRYGFLGAASTGILIQVGLVLLLLPASLRAHPVHLASGALFRWLVFSVILGIGLWLSAPFLTNDRTTAIGLIGAGVFIVLAAWLSGLLGIVRKLRIAA